MYTQLDLLVFPRKNYLKEIVAINIHLYKLGDTGKDIRDEVRLLDSSIIEKELFLVFPGELPKSLADELDAVIRLYPDITITKKVL
jgi:hypothetical protein